MKKSIFALGVLALSTSSAFAAMHTDSHGNVGYDTAAECDAAVRAGTAKMYESFTHKPPLKRKGETAVRVMRLGDVVGPVGSYANGACDLGAARRAGRDGVSRALQGKYVPYSPDMPVNVYSDRNGRMVRMTMKQCDNWFSGNFPRPVALPAVAPQPVAPVVITPAAPVVVAPAPAPVVVVPAVVTPAAASAATGSTFGMSGLGIMGLAALAVAAIAADKDDATTSTTATTSTR